MTDFSERLLCIARRSGRSFLKDTKTERHLEIISEHDFGEPDSITITQAAGDLISTKKA